MLESLISALGGPRQARKAHQRALAHNPGIKTGLEQVQQAAPLVGIEDDQEPIFLLSAGWRSGSTLLQRLIMSDSRVLMWGEPYDECGPVQALAGLMQAFRPGWPPQEYYHDGTPPADLSGDWVANLFPGLDDWRASHRAFFDTMFAHPAQRAGASRWGVKEVRLQVEHGLYLRWLYPRARFVFLYRNPLDAYRSYARYGSNWYDVFPDRPVFTPTAFGRHWRQTMEGFLRDGKRLDAMMVRYEDLIGNKPPLADIENHLGVSIDASVLHAKVGSSERHGRGIEIGRLEKMLLKRAVGPLAAELGYVW